MAVIIENGTSRQGTLTSYGRLLDALSARNAERDEKGRFKIIGDHAPALFLGIETRDNDVLVDDSQYCLIDGEKVSLLRILCGQGVTVIGVY